LHAEGERVVEGVCAEEGRLQIKRAFPAVVDQQVVAPDIPLALADGACRARAGNEQIGLA
jgi:hypothetical protein